MDLSDRPASASPLRGRPMELYDPRLLRLLTFLTRRQGWLSPTEISRDFRLDGEIVSKRTLHRWFLFLRARAALVYYPYPRANVLGLQDVLVRLHGLHEAAILGVMPFGSSFNAEVALGSGHPFVSQGYWVPGPAMTAFTEYWQTARDLGLVEEVDVFWSRNTHFLYSPFEQMIREGGVAELQGEVDNRHFETLVRRNLKEAHRVSVGDRVAESPLLVPLALERIWAHYSSKQVWKGIQEKGEEVLLAYGKSKLAHAVQRPGAALQLLQTQWSALLEHYDEVFLQPRVLFDWTQLRNAMWASFVLRPGSLDRMVEVAGQASRRSILVQLKPGLDLDERCHLLCFAPNDQLLALHEIVRKFHRGVEPPIVALQDRKATLNLFQAPFCKLDWRMFDPVSLEWRFDGGQYIEALKTMKPP